MGPDVFSAHRGGMHRPRRELEICGRWSYTKAAQAVARLTSRILLLSECKVVRREPLCVRLPPSKNERNGFFWCRETAIQARVLEWLSQRKTKPGLHPLKGFFAENSHGTAHVTSRLRGGKACGKTVIAVRKGAR
eukprot:54714-Chlamydomonas_euryale.AAC.1